MISRSKKYKRTVLTTMPVRLVNDKTIPEQELTKLVNRKRRKITQNRPARISMPRFCAFFVVKNAEFKSPTSTAGTATKPWFSMKRRRSSPDSTQLIPFRIHTYKNLATVQAHRISNQAAKLQTTEFLTANER
jgi:hypothetical protein